MKKTKDHTPQKLNITIGTDSSITDYSYNHNGRRLAVADSDGYVYVYARHQHQFVKESQFRGDDAAVWKVTWSDPAHGSLLAVASFKSKVGVFQQKGQEWQQIAYHNMHEGSVNHVEWASPAFGIKLYSAGNDGSITILELKKNQWTTNKFFAHEAAVTSFTLRPPPLNEQESQTAAYPMIASVAKDNLIKIWRHTLQIPEQQIEANARIYQQVGSCKSHQQSIRCLLWKKYWSVSEPLRYSIFSSSEEGGVTLNNFEKDELSGSVVIGEFNGPVFRLAQSLTGNQLSVSVAGEDIESSFVFVEKQHGWEQRVQLQ